MLPSNGIHLSESGTDRLLRNLDLSKQPMRRKQRQRHERTRRSPIRVDESARRSTTRINRDPRLVNESNQHQQRHVQPSTDRDVMQELTRDDTQRDDNEWRVVSRRWSMQNRRTPCQCMKCGESNHITARCKQAGHVQCRQCGANKLDMYNVDNVASWATKRNITHGTRRSANTIWPPELLTPIIYVQGIILVILVKPGLRLHGER